MDTHTAFTNQLRIGRTNSKRKLGKKRHWLHAQLKAFFSPFKRKRKRNHHLNEAANRLRRIRESKVIQFMFIDEFIDM